MRHLYEPAAYDFGVPVKSYWESTVIQSMTDQVESDMEADVVIVGAGYTGLSCALHLARDHGGKALVLEAGYPGWGASGRNGGFCCMGGDAAGQAVLERRFGAQAAVDWTRHKADAVYTVAELLDRHDIDADVQPGGEVCLAHSPRAWRALQAEAATLEKQLRVGCDLIAPQDLAARGMAMRGALGALHLPIGFGLNPLKYARGLMRAATMLGADIRGLGTVTDLKRGPRGFTLRANGFLVQARQVVLATNGYSAEDLPDWMAGRFMPVLSNIMVTRPLTEAELAAQGWTSRIPSYDSRNLLHYFRLLPDNRLMFGARGNTRLTPRATARTKRMMRRDFDRMFPAWTGVETAYFWSGLVCMTRPFTPYIGALAGWPGAWTGFGYHGNGVAMATQAGRALAGLVAGENAAGLVPQVARSAPPPFPVPRHRRSLLPLGVALKGLLDRF